MSLFLVDTSQKITYDNVILKYHMSTISVPLTQNLEEFIEEMIRLGTAPTKAEVVRQAIARYAEDQAVTRVLRAEQEFREGKILRGDLRKLLQSMP